MVEDDREEVAAPDDTASPPADVAPPPADQFDGDLAEFDRAMAQPSGPTIDDFLAEPEPDAEAIDTMLRGDDSAFHATETLRIGSQIEALRQGNEVAQERAARLEHALFEVQQREWLRSEQAEFNALVQEGEQRVSDFNLPPDFARRFLLSEAQLDPRLREAWDRRNDQSLSLQTRMQFSGYIRNTLSKLTRAAKMVPDKEATEDRELVTQAVRGAGGKVMADPPPNLGKMSDRELRDYTSQFGF